MDAGLWTVKAALFFGLGFVLVFAILAIAISRLRRKNETCSSDTKVLSPMMDLSFKCPDCGGSSYGSAAITPDPEGPLHRYCHGNDAGDGLHGCKFNWPEEKDWKYFRWNGRKLKSPEEHKAALKKSTPGQICGL